MSKTQYLKAIGHCVLRVIARRDWRYMRIARSHLAAIIR